MSRDDDLERAGAVSAVEGLLKYDYIREEDIDEVIKLNEETRSQIKSKDILRELEMSY